jgi:hypothetical protein
MGKYRQWPVRYNAAGLLEVLILPHGKGVPSRERGPFVIPKGWHHVDRSRDG